MFSNLVCPNWSFYGVSKRCMHLHNVYSSTATLCLKKVPKQY